MTAVCTYGLAKRFGTVEALAPLDLELAEGEVLGYLGPNGAGKTTTLRLLLGLLRPSAGRAEIFGLDARRQAVDAHRRLAYVPGEAALWPSLTGAETLHLLGRIHGQVGRGQTVFLSSHILSEVEAVCDRVAILRSGKLVETGTLAEMRHLAAVSVEAVFSGTVPDVAGVTGITAVDVSDHRLRCQVRGSIDPLLQRLAGTGVTHLLSREPSLEELFLAHYGTADA